MSILPFSPGGSLEKSTFMDSSLPSVIYFFFYYHYGCYPQVLFAFSNPLHFLVLSLWYSINLLKYYCQTVFLLKFKYLIKVPFHCISLWCALSLLSSRDLAHGIVGKYHNSFVKELISSAYKSISFQEGNFLANVFSSFN